MYSIPLAVFLYHIKCHTVRQCSGIYAKFVSLVLSASSVL